MDRIAASNRSIRMEHNTTVIHIMVPLNRYTRFRIPDQNALQASSSYEPTQWMSPSSPSSLTVFTSYRAQVPIPTPGFRFSTPLYNFPPPYITPSNMSTTSKFPKRSQYSTPPYVPPCSCPPYPTQSSMPVYTSLSPSLTYTSPSSTTSNTYQTSKFPKEYQYLTPPYVPPYSCPPHTTQSSMPVHAYPLSSDYTSPRSTDYTMPFLGVYSTVMPQSSTQNSYLSSMNESSINVWPTKIGSVMHVSVENIGMVLANQFQNASQPSTTARADLIAPRENDQSLKCFNPKPTYSTKTSSNSCARNHSEKSEETLMPIYKNDNGDIDTQLHNAWVYFNKLEIVDIKPNGEIKCICPMIQFEDLLKLSINDKRILLNLCRYYENNKKLFEETYDYNSLPQNTIVTEKIENEVLEWLISLEMEEYDWFFNSLSLYEIENISLKNIQKFIMRSKSNKTISLEDQLKICCVVKKIKEWPVSLIAIAMNLQEDRIDEEPFESTVYPYINEIFLFPSSITKHFLFEDIMKASIIGKMIKLQFSKKNVLKKDTQPDTNSNMGDSLDTEMENSEINYMVNYFRNSI